MLTPSKRDLVLLASGVWPVLFHNRAYSETRSRGRGLAVYLDVSGSVYDDLPRILGVLGNMQSDIEKVFTFSNDIVETSLKALAKGEGIQTTYGTDFDCVAASILERSYPKAVVITDGDSQEAPVQMKGPGERAIIRLPREAWRKIKETLELDAKRSTRWNT